MPKILLIIPCYQESKRLPPFLHELSLALTGLNKHAEILEIQVVDDGSGADEAAALKQLIEQQRALFPCLKPGLFLPQNRGKGGAIKTGWNQPLADDVEWLGFVDADGACPAAEVVRLAQMCLERGPAAGAFIASRVKMLGRQVERLWQRHVLGRIFATAVAELLQVPVYDSQCGLKLIPRAAYERIKPQLTLDGYAFDVELILALLKSHCAVTEVPINWREKPGGKVHLLRDSWKMGWDVLRLWKRWQ
jgi:dolichyl-phosphate beta-glucosyltransferase